MAECRVEEKPQPRLGKDSLAMATEGDVGTAA